MILRIVILLFAANVAGFSQSAEIIRVDKPYLGYIGESCEYYEDQTNALELDAIKLVYRKNEFTQIKSPIYVNSSGIPDYWFRFQLASQLSEAIWLNINNSNLVKVDLYKLNSENRVVDSCFTGCLHPKSTRGFDTETFWFPLVKENDTELYTFYLCLKGGISLEAPFEVGTFNRLLKMKTSSDALALLFIGAMLLMFAYNLLVFFSTKDRIYLTYSFYIISVMLGTTFLNNYPIIESFIGIELTYSYTASWLVTTFIGVGFFGIRYLNMKNNYPWFYHAIRIELLILISYGLLNFFIPSDYLAMSYEIVVSIFYATAILAAFFIFRKERNSKTGLYALGWSLMISGSFVYLLVINDVLIYTAITRNAMYFGVTCEVLIFSIALARRLNELKLIQERLNAELELTNVALQTNNESLDSFNYHVSHDLKTVLNNSNALARMVIKYNVKKDNEKVAEIAQKLLNVTANGAETVQSFLTLGKIDSLFRHELAVKINIIYEINRILETHQLQNKIAIQFKKMDFEILMMHQKAIESIFLNLFTNTIKYSVKAPLVHLYFSSYEHEFEIKYIDFGKGIDMKSYGHLLFKPFERGGADSATEGTGVGLYVLKRIVQMYQGHVELKSELGQGIELTLSFPKSIVALD